MEGLKGYLLIANGSLYGDTFRQTVILMAEHNAEGAVGFVLNKPTEMLIGDEEGEIVHDSPIDHRVFYGGPVQHDAIAIVADFTSAEFAESIIFDTVGFPSADSALSNVGMIRARVFAGYSGWGPGQLEKEMEEGSWITEPASVDLVFDIDPDELWAEVLRRKGGRYALMASMPYDPSNN